MLSAVLMVLRNEVLMLPGDFVKAMALLLNRDWLWIAENVTAQELVESLPVLDRVNDFGALWAALKAAGVVVGYEQ